VQDGRDGVREPAEDPADIVGDADQRTAHHEPPREIRQVGEYGGRHLRCEADDETDDLVEVAQHLAAPQQADRLSYVLGTYGSPVSRQRLRGRGGHCTPEGFIGEQRLRRAPRRQQIGEQRPDRRLADAPVPGRGAARDRVDEAIPRVAATCTQEGSDAAGAPREGSRFARSLPPSAEAD